MLNKTWPTLNKIEKDIRIDCITYAGSAFAICENGDQVFLSARIVEKMDLCEGDICSAVMLENYPDKSDQIPWRAVRVDCLEA